MAGLGIYHVFTVILLVVSESQGQSENPNYVIVSQTPADCRRDADAVVQEFFDISRLRCTACSQNATLQIANTEGLRCQCTETSRLTEDYGGGNITCEYCPTGKVAAQDGWACVTCDIPADPGDPDTCQDCQDPLDITVERDLNGSRLENSQDDPVVTCVSCDNDQGAAPGEDGLRCTRCNQVLSVQVSGCVCDSDRETGGLCFSNVEDLEDPNQQSLYEVQYDNAEIVTSAYFLQHIRASRGMCGPSYSNLTACQSLGNLCILLLYRYSSGRIDACSLHRDLFDIHGEGIWGIQQWRNNSPWLYYPANTGNVLLHDEGIPISYTDESIMEFTLGVYSVEGEFLGYRSAAQGAIQLCKDLFSAMNAAFHFGKQYRQACHLYVDALYDSPDYDLYFYDMYMDYESQGQPYIYPIPVLIRNSNRGSDPEEWQLVRRFYLVDRLSGIPDSGAPRSVVLRYAAGITLHVTIQDDNNNGKIYVPYLEIEYQQVTSEQYGEENHVQVTFEVKYHMDLGGHRRDLAISLGVLCTLAVLYAGYQAANWQRRMGRIALDFVTLAKLLLYLCGTLANAFSLVLFGFTVWWFIMYKLQKTIILVPDTESENDLHVYLGVAFALKSLQLIHIIGVQVTADIFFLDWEKPPDSMTSQAGSANKKASKKEPQASIWRTYFVANEWNELQTVRRIWPIFQLMLVMLFLNVIGFENWARFDVSGSLNVPADEPRGQFSQIFRFAVGAIVYICTAFGQWLFFALIWSRFSENALLNFVDLCSMTNISVFIMTHDNFGYYIHGRSIHGHADTDMRGMCAAIGREEEDLCGRRGLEEHRDQQTFEIALPKQLRKEYNKVLIPLTLARARAGGPQSRSRLDEDLDNKLHAYGILNKFLQNFIDHNLPNISYMVADKKLHERILDTEFEDSTDMGIFYNDWGHSFDRTLFYGEEGALQLFGLLFFSIVDLIASNYILAAVLTYLVDLALCALRDSLGRKNISKKALVDERFLI